MNQLSSTY